MPDLSDLRIEPSAEILGAVRQWLSPVRAALSGDFLAAYLTGSVLTQGFDPRKSRINVLVLTRNFGDSDLEALARAMPAPVKKGPQFDPLFMTRRQLEKSLDAFPIEYLEMKERHLLLEGDDLLGAVEVPRTYLRLQLEHELRGKHLRLRQFLLFNWNDPETLAASLESAASGFATLFRTLLRLQNEIPPADSAHVVQRVADLFGLDSQALLGAHLAKTAGVKREDALRQHRSFVAELERLIRAIDELKLP